MSSIRVRPVSRVFHWAGRTTQKSLAAVGLVTVAGVAWEYHSTRPEKKSESDKRVLVIPFYKMELVETKPRGWKQTLKTLSESEWDETQDQRPVKVAVADLIQVLHKAADDPSIVALYGIFGRGNDFNPGGWANLEQVRNALTVFRESHRTHLEPNLDGKRGDHKQQDDSTKPEKPAPKPMFAYADTFHNPTRPVNPEYVLASAFTFIQMQQQGELSLFGMSSGNTFLKDALRKYGVQVHVFRTGDYKTAPNIFSERAFNKPHRQALQQLLGAIGNKLYTDIYHGRQMESHGWDSPNTFTQALLDSQTFAAKDALKCGFVNAIVPYDPLDDVIRDNDKKNQKKKKEDSKPDEPKLDKRLPGLTANKAVAFQDYHNQIQKQTKREQRMNQLKQRLESFADKSGVGKFLHNIYCQTVLKQEAPIFPQQVSHMPKEKIAVLNVNGTITNRMGRRVVASLKDIQKDENVKCVVLRVNSRGGNPVPCEAILQQAKQMPQKVVVSFGNVSASGGYKIAAYADRIFASENSITGSIGVFGIRPDVTQMAAQYGVRFDHVNMGKYTAMWDPTYPMTKDMKANMMHSVNQSYADFVDEVAQGRGMTTEQVQAIAEGRVFTGRQAKEIGLVDELGGLDRAIAYAQRNFTTSGKAQVRVWSRPSGLFSRNSVDFASMVAWFTTGWGQSTPQRPMERRLERLLASTLSQAPRNWSGVSMAMDENAAIECLLEELEDAQPK